MGQGPDRAASIEETHITLTSRYGLRSEAGVGLLGGRADITAVRWRAEAAAHQVGIAQAQFYQMSLCQRLLVIRHLVWIICLIVVMKQVQFVLRSTTTIYGVGV